MNAEGPIKIIVIGNGFDIALGFKTRYSDFIEHDLFKRLCSYGDSNFPRNALTKHLERVTTIQNWVDFENEIRAYALTLSQICREPHSIFPEHTRSVSSSFYENIRSSHQSISNHSQSKLTYYVDNFISEYESLKRNFFKYLNLEVTTEYKKQLPKSILDEENKKPFDQAYSFNYTDTIACLNTENKFWVHGKLKDESAVLGVDDVSDLLPKFIQILKSAHTAFGNVNVTDAMNQADEIHFFGLSFGETDNVYFQSAFTAFALGTTTTLRSSQRGLQISDHVQKRKLVFHIHNEQARLHTLNRLQFLTNMNLSGLRLKNEVVFTLQNTPI